MAYMYLDKPLFRETLIQFQELSPDIDPTWLGKYKAFPKRKLTEEELLEWENVKSDFIAWKREKYAEKSKRLLSESIEETKARLAKFDVVKERLGEMYLKIIDGVLRMPEFNNKHVDYDTRQDMKCDAAMIMYRYSDKFDTRRLNPFSFFTEMAKNACRKQKNDRTNYELKFHSVDFLENLDRDGDGE